MQRAIEQRKALVGRDHINAVGLHFEVVPCLENLHRCNSLQQLGHHANIVWVEMLNYHECHPVVFGHVFKEQFQCFKPACRGTDAYDGEQFYFIFIMRGVGDIADNEPFADFFDFCFLVFIGKGLRFKR